LACCGAARISTMSAQNPVVLTARQGGGENIGQRLFVHE
jgi:hypothetical protein